MRHCLRLAVIPLLALVAASCSAPRPKPAPVHYALPPHTGAAGPNDILFRAIGLVGTPYHWGGTSPESGFDCSGLVVYVFLDVAGIALPRTVQEISALDTPTVNRDALLPGDLIFFDTEGRHLSHIGIYVGAGRFVHAPNEGGTVRLDYLSNSYWDKRYSDAKRVPL